MNDDSKQIDPAYVYAGGSFLTSIVNFFNGACERRSAKKRQAREHKHQLFVIEDEYKKLREQKEKEYQQLLDVEEKRHEYALERDAKSYEYTQKLSQATLNAQQTGIYFVDADFMKVERFNPQKLMVVFDTNVSNHLPFQSTDSVGINPMIKLKEEFDKQLSMLGLSNDVQTTNISKGFHDDAKARNFANIALHGAPAMVLYGISDGMNLYIKCVYKGIFIDQLIINQKTDEIFEHGSIEQKTLCELDIAFLEIFTRAEPQTTRQDIHKRKQTLMRLIEFVANTALQTLVDEHLCITKKGYKPQADNLLKGYEEYFEQLQPHYNALKKIVQTNAQHCLEQIDAIRKVALETYVKNEVEIKIVTPKVETIYLGGEEIPIDTTFLNLSFRNISHIPDINLLRKLTKLTILNLQSNMIYDISALGYLSNLSDLYHLSLANNKISDITPLLNLTQLRYLDLENNQISNVSDILALGQLKKLTTLTLGGLKVNLNSTQMRALKQSLPNCYVSFSTLY